MAILCAVGDGLQNDPTFVGRSARRRSGGVPIRMVSQAAARRNITLVIREADLEPTRCGGCTSGSSPRSPSGVAAST